MTTHRSNAGRRAHSITDTAHHFDYHENAFRRLIREGKVKAPRRLYPGGKPFYTDDDIVEIEEASKRDRKIEEVA